MTRLCLLHSPKLNQKIQVQVGSQYLLQQVFYYVVGRGQVLISQVAEIAFTNIGVFEFNATLTMAPSSTLVVYFLSERGEIFSDETEFTFEPEVLANPVSITVSETRLKPNQELTVTMTTGDNSQVALSVVDQNVLLENQGNDLSRNKVYNAMRLYDNAGDMDLDASYSESYNRLLVS
jgi:Alpha-2-macroglobulin bait region domain